MTTIDFAETELENLITHHVGNKFRDEKCTLSSEESNIDNSTKEYLLKYFFTSVKPEELYAFVHSVKLDMNEVYTILRGVFSGKKKFINSSQDIAKLLYEQSLHPKIQEGELNIAYFKNAILDGEPLDAIGIFKSESNIPYLKMNSQRSKFSINHDFGFEIKNIDKGCIIFNTNEDAGFKMVILDNASRAAEAQYWKDQFLQVRPISNEFHQTSQLLSIAKTFVTEQIAKEYEVNKTDQIEYLNRSIQFFKENDQFDEKEFVQDVFQDKDLIKSFKRYKGEYQQENEIELSDSFEISAQAVKKQSRVFKSVLKLDKNFHIYIHGDKELIEKGVDRDGRKYYKIYYEEEN